jgi:protein disulfide-isomerase A1
MRTTTLLACWTPALAAATLLEDLTPKVFDTMLAVRGSLLVSFTSKTLEPVIPFNNVFAEAADYSETLFVTINCDIETALCNKYDINAYPTIRIFDRKYAEMHMSRYRGPKTSKALLSLVKRRELPALSHLQKASDMDFRRVDPFVLVAFLAPDDASHLATFEALAQKHYFDFAFGYTTNTAFAEKEGVYPPSIIAYRNEDRDNVILGGAFTYKDAENFLAATKTSRVIKDFREKDVDIFMQRDKLTVYIFTRVPDEVTKIRRELIPVAKKYERFVTFAVVDVGRYAEMPQNFGIEMKEDEAVVVHAPGNDNLFFYKQGDLIKEKCIENMLLAILEGRASQGEVFGSVVNDAEERHDEL